MRGLQIASAMFLVVLAPGTALGQTTPAGSVTLLNGQAEATGTSGPAHPLAKGDAVYSGDLIETGRRSYAMMRFSDEGSVLLRPNSRFHIEKYQYAAAPSPQAAAQAAATPAAPLVTGPAAETDSTFFRLLKGGLRAVSGLVARADYSRYEMSSPVATIGIRGTDYLIAMCEEGCLTDPAVLQGLPPGETLDGALVSGVNQGKIVVTSFTGRATTLGPGQFVVTLADGTQYLLNLAPAFLSTDTEAVVESGVAAGSTTAASAAANGNLLIGVAAATTSAILIGVVVGSSDQNGAATSSNGGGTTSTISTLPTAAVAR